MSEQDRDVFSVFVKGTIVRIGAKVVTKVPDNEPYSVIDGLDNRTLVEHRPLLKRELPDNTCGIVVGIGRRISGDIEREELYSEDRGHYLDIGRWKNAVHHRVLMVELLGTRQYLNPIACLPEDVLEIL